VPAEDEHDHQRPQETTPAVRGMRDEAETHSLIRSRCGSSSSSISPTPRFRAGE
jgi:hypothetical protein